MVSFIPSQLALCQISAACHPCSPQFLLRMLTLAASSSSSGRGLDVFMAFTSLCTWEGLALVWNLGNGTGDLLITNTSNQNTITICRSARIQERLRDNIFSDFFILAFYFLSFGISYKIGVFFSFSDNSPFLECLTPPPSC